MPNHYVAQSIVRTVVAIVAFAWIVVGPAWGAEWTSIAEEDSKIFFDVPGLTGGVFLKKSDYSGNEGLAIWEGAPRGAVYLRILAPNILYRKDSDLREVTKIWPFLEEKDLKFLLEETTINAVGRVKYRRFTTDGWYCVSFLQGWGSSATWGNDRGVSPNNLFGYYCDRGALSDDTVKAVLGGIGVRGYKVPVSAAAKFTPRQMGSFDGDWVLKIVEPTYIPKGVKVNTEIADNNFSAVFSGGGWHGEISGEIDTAGTLFASGYTVNTAWKGQWARQEDATVLMEFSTDYVNGLFQHSVSGGGGVDLEFRITLTRVSP